MPAETNLHGLKSDQVYVIFEALLAGKTHTLYETATRMARQYCDKYQEAVLKPYIGAGAKRATAA